MKIIVRHKKVYYFCLMLNFFYRHIRILTLITAMAAAISQSAYTQPKREMRGTWIASVANIDWPARQGMCEDSLKLEMRAILDNAVACNLNTVVFQIRPTSDALYRSSYEPWSHWLTGEQGAEPCLDPLEFVIGECDKRGLSVHVWLNPYRVWLDRKNIELATHKDHPYHKYNDWVILYDKIMLLNPAKPEVREYVCNIVAEITRDYDIDAIHMDDYFYPYKVAGKNFPDDADFKADPRGFKNKENWRRDNVDLIVKQISDTIKAIKPWVEFGISPFGVWRNASVDPKGSDTRAGQTNYDDLYADILKWEREGWIDYVAPQIYWHMGFRLADYRTLAKWWNDNAYGTPLYIGHALYRINPNSSTQEWRSAMEIVRQIKLNRTLENIGGSMLYSAKFLADRHISKTLVDNVYRHMSLVPVNPRIEPIIPEAPEAPVMAFIGNYIEFEWEPMDNNRRFVIYRLPVSGKQDINNPANIIAVTGETFIRIRTDAVSNYRYAITALSPTHHESAPVYFNLM